MSKRLMSAAAAIFGLVAWYGIVILTDFLLVNQFAVDGAWRYVVLGLVEFLIGGAVVIGSLRLARIAPPAVGFTRHKLWRDAACGLAVALIFAALQFFVIIPATGGAGRSDVVANSAQLGSSVGDLAGMLFLAVFGSTAEEMLFRGLLLGGLAFAFGNRLTAKILVTLFVTVLFALSHGYQGWAGIIDTGLYGGLTLSLLYWWRGGRLVAPVVAHVAWNVLAMLWIFFVLS